MITNETITFIRDHAHSLTSLDVGECVAKVEDSHADSMSWAKFFDTIYGAKPVLSRVVAGNILVPPLAVDYEIFEDDYTPEELRRIQEVRDQLKSQPSLKAFGYSSWFDWPIYSVYYPWSMLQFKRGHDQRAYERLMCLVNKNAARVPDE